MDISSALKIEAINIVQELGLLEMLEPYGEARLVGSVALDLVVKPDIDIHLLLDRRDVIEATKEIAEYIIIKKKVKEVRISDHLESDSLKIGIDRYSGTSAVWSIDIWVTSDESTTGFQIAEDLKNTLTPELREAILNIKRAHYKDGQLRDGLSLKIYKAALEKGLSGLDEFKGYQGEEHTGSS
jgi:hypothetical protein